MAGVGLDQQSSSLEAGVDAFDELHVVGIDGSGLAVGDQVERLHEPDPSDIADDRVSLLQLSQFSGEVFTCLGSVFDQSLGLDQFPESRPDEAIVQLESRQGATQEVDALRQREIAADDQMGLATVVAETATSLDLVITQVNFQIAGQRFQFL